MRALLALGFVSMIAAIGVGGCSSSSSTGTVGTTTGVANACTAIELKGDCLTCAQNFCANQTAGCFGDAWAMGPTAGAPCSEYDKCARGSSCPGACPVDEACHECSVNQFGPCITKHCAAACE